MKWKYKWDREESHGWTPRSQYWWSSILVMNTWEVCQERFSAYQLELLWLKDHSVRRIESWLNFEIGLGEKYWNIVCKNEYRITLIWFIVEREGGFDSSGRVLFLCFHKTGIKRYFCTVNVLQQPFWHNFVHSIC